MESNIILRDLRGIKDLEKKIVKPYLNKDFKILELSKIPRLPNLKLKVSRFNRKKIHIEVFDKNYDPVEFKGYINLNKSDEYYTYFNKLLEEVKL